MKTLYSKLSDSTRRRFTEPEVDEQVRAVLAKHVHKTFAEAVERVAFRMEVSRTVANLLADQDFIRDTYQKAMQSGGTR